jgi:predicted kinase
VLSRDAIKRALFGAYDVGDIQNEYAFDTLLDVLPLSLSLAPGVIIDGVPFAKIGQAERVECVAHRSGAVSVVFWLDCDIETASYRVALDHTGPSNRSTELVRRVAAEFRDIPSSWVRIDALQTPSEIEAYVFSILSSMDVISHRGSRE